MIAQPAMRTAAELRFVNALRGENDLAAVVGVLDAAFGGAFMHRLPDLRFRPPHEALPVGEVFSARVQSAVDDVHIR